MAHAVLAEQRLRDAAKLAAKRRQVEHVAEELPKVTVHRVCALWLGKRAVGWRREERVRGTAGTAAAGPAGPHLEEDGRQARLVVELAQFFGRVAEDLSPRVSRAWRRWR